MKITQDYFDLMISRGVTDFTDLDLTDIKAMGIKFVNAVFCNTILKGVDFRQSIFESETWHVTFKKCNLDQVVFRGCGLGGERFSECNIEGAKFNDADLENARFYKCNLSGSVFDNAAMYHVTIEDSLTLFADFSNANKDCLVIY
jgi:uncharacterized protein YjbI with pentapeptide repeats